MCEGIMRVPVPRGDSGGGSFFFFLIRALNVSGIFNVITVHHPIIASAITTRETMIQKNHDVIVPHPSFIIFYAVAVVVTVLAVDTFFTITIPKAVLDDCIQVIVIIVVGADAVVVEVVKLLLMLLLLVGPAAFDVVAVATA